MKDFFQSEDGNMATIGAIALVPILGLVALAVDHSVLINHRTNMQDAADNAALASALAITEQRNDVAVNTFYMNLPNNNKAKPTFSQTGNSVMVVGTDKVDLVFGGLLGQKTVDVKVVSEAAIGKKGPDSACVLVLDPSRSRAMMVSSDANLEIDCGLQVNSSSRDGASVRSRGTLTATNVNVVGQSDVASGGHMSVTAAHNVDPVEDPFASLVAPPEATGDCDYTTNFDFDVDDGPQVFEPGIYCGRLYFHRGADITLRPGVHVFKNNIDARGYTKIHAEGVMMYFEGENAYLNLHNNAELTLTAPSTGDYRGIAIFKDRDTDSRAFNFHSDSESIIKGSIYIPNGELSVHSRATLQQTAKNTKIVVKTMDIDQYANVEVLNDETSEITLPQSINVSSVDSELRLIR